MNDERALRELVYKWFADADDLKAYGENEASIAVWDCAKELEALLNQQVEAKGSAE